MHCTIRQFFKIVLPVTALFLVTLNISGQVQKNDPDTSAAKGKIKQPVYYATRLKTARPVIDGKLDDACWKTGIWADKWHQFIPNEGAEPTYPTSMDILYDDKNLYIAFRAYDYEPKNIQRFAGGRDEYGGDLLGINFDSYHDYRTGFEFTVSAWGQKLDVVLFNPNKFDPNWNPVWKVKVGMEDSAWVAEYEIPFSQLRYSGKEDQVWGMHTWRLISRLQEESNWNIQTKTSPGMLYNFGELRGITGLKKSRRLELLPYTLGSLSTMKEETGNPFTTNGKKWGRNIGLDAKIGISSNFTLDLTVNPDFGQVESDPSVMNLTAFETFYPEKRPFFLEGLTIYDYDFDDMKLFYSRRIGHAPSLKINSDGTRFVNEPDWTTILSAVKLSGTTSKGLSLGFLQSVTGPEFAKISDNAANITKYAVEPLTSYTVARIQKGYHEGSTVIGGMITSTNRAINDSQLDFLTNNAFSGGLDLLHRFDDNKFLIDARLLGSYVNGSKTAMNVLQESSARYYQRPGADYLDYDTSRTSLSGTGGRFRIGKGAGGHWKYATGVTWLTPGLELNDIGYIQQVDNINQKNELSYLITQPVSIFKTLEVGVNEFNRWNFNGTYLGSSGQFTFNSLFKNNWRFMELINFFSEAVDPRLLRGGPEFIKPGQLSSIGMLSSDDSKRFIAGVSYTYQHSGDNSGSLIHLEPQISMRPFMMLKLGVSASWEKNSNDLQYVGQATYLAEPRYILGSIDQGTVGMTFKADLNISPTFSIQYYGSPFVSHGFYSDYKRVTNPKAGELADRYEVYANASVSNGSLSLDENNDGTPDYSTGDPNFNFCQFRSNFVAKWEYRLGSFIYLVWSGERTTFTNEPENSVGKSFKQLFKATPKNIFMIKLNYWFSL